MAFADLALTTSNDLSIEAGDLQLAYDDDKIQQSLRIRLEDVRGNWFRDLTYGTDWFGSILGKKSDLARKAEIRRVALGTQGVAQIKRLELTTTGRSMSVDLEVVKDDGATLAIRFAELLGGA